METGISDKRKLYFRNGRFRAVCFSDLHGVARYDRRTFRDLAAICDGISPDLVLFLGDQVWQDGAENAESLKNYLSPIEEILGARDIPWAHTFGNHDAERGFPVCEQEAVYEAFPHCISVAGPASLHGTGNYILPILSPENGRPEFLFWCLDSHRDMREFLEDAGLSQDYRQVMMPDPLYISQSYDTVRFDQILWYWQTSLELESRYGKKLPGAMVMHMPLPEFVIPYKNVAQTGYRGTRREACGTAPVNPGLFSALVQRGDVKTLVAGHDHINDYTGEYLGIKMAYDAGLSYDNYCDDDLRGGRVLDIPEGDPWHMDTWMVRSSEYIENYPGKPIFD